MQLPPTHQRQPCRRSFVCTQILVQFKPGANAAASLASVAHGGKPASARRRIAKRADGSELVVATLPAGLNVTDALKAFRSQSNVLYAEPNYKMYKASREEGQRRSLRSHADAACGVLLGQRNCHLDHLLLTSSR